MTFHPNTKHRIVYRRITILPPLEIFRKHFNFVILCKIILLSKHPSPYIANGFSLSLSLQFYKQHQIPFFSNFKTINKTFLKHINEKNNHFPFTHFRSCLQWWKVLPPPYKFFLILVGLVVLLVSYLYLQKLVNYIRNATDDGRRPNKIIPNPEYPLPPSASILHQFKGGAVCSDAEQCSKIGRFVLVMWFYFSFITDYFFSEIFVPFVAFTFKNKTEQN